MVLQTPMQYSPCNIGPGTKEKHMPTETMTSRERWLAVLNRETPDRVPMDYWATQETNVKLMAHLGCATMEEVFAQLHIDAPLHVGGRYVGPPPKENTDVFGIEYHWVDYGTGAYHECKTHPLEEFETVEEIEAEYAFPNPDWWEYSHIPDVVTGQEHRPVRGGGSEPFLTYTKLRGDIQANIDMIENPEIVEYVLGKLFGLAYENTRRIFEVIPGRVDITYVAEDLGSQTGLLFSPAHIRRFLLPGMKRMMDLTKQAGSHVFTHSDGAIRTIIPDLIETGTEVLNPVQWVCEGMDREGLKADFGADLLFHGSMENQRILPFGTVTEVKQEVEDNLNTLGKGGGYILAPCHNLQPITPMENIIAMYEHGYALGFDRN